MGLMYKKLGGRLRVVVELYRCTNGVGVGGDA